MARFLDIIKSRLASASSVALDVGVEADTQIRLQVDSGGKLTWGSGSAAGDTTLYRSDADTLATDDVFKALAGLVTLTTVGAPTEILPNGAIAIDTTNNVFYFRSDSLWKKVSGGASVSVTAPTSPLEGDLWFQSDTLDLFIYYTSAWLQLTGLDDGVVDIGDLADVVITNALANQVLTYDGTEWVNQPPTGTALTDATIIAGIGGDGTSGQAIVTDGAGSLSFSTIIGTTEASIVSAVGGDGAAGQVLKTNGAGDLSLGDVAEAQVTGLTTALGLKAPLASPALTGVPTAPTASVATDTTQIATTAFVIANAPTPALTGPITSVGNATSIASQTGTGTTFAMSASPTFTGVPAADTASVGTNTTQLATTAFVLANGGGVTASSTPPGSPSAGMLWFNQDTAQTFIYYDSQWIEVGSSGMAATLSSAAPANPIPGEIWFNQDTAQTFLYYDSQWIEIGASGMTAVVSGSIPTDPVTGLLWYNSDTGGTYVYYNTIWVEVGAAPFNYIMNTINAKGDLLVGTADNAITGVTVGTNGQVLTAASGEASGVSWTTPTVYTHPNHSGDVTSVADGAQTIALNAVTNAKTAQMATKTYKGRTSALTGDPEDVAVATLKTDLILVKGDVGLGDVDNTTDAGKPVSTAGQTALDLKADIASPTLTGVPAAPTAVANTNTTQLATTAFVRAEVAALVASAPASLDTLNELALALGSDPDFATTVTNSLASKAPLASPTFTGIVTLPTPYTIGAVSMTATGTELNHTVGVTSAIQTQLDAKATTGRAVAMALVFGGG